MKCSICEEVFYALVLDECIICGEKFCLSCITLEDGKCDICIEDEKRAHEGDYYGISELKED